MDDHIVFVFSIALQLVIQVFQFRRNTGATTAAAGQCHVARLIIIGGKWTCPVIKRLHTAVSGTTFRNDVTLNNNH